MKKLLMLLLACTLVLACTVPCAAQSSFTTLPQTTTMNPTDTFVITHGTRSMAIEQQYLDGWVDGLINSVGSNMGMGILTDTGTANNYIVTLPSPLSVTTGLLIQMLAANTNTGASTLTIAGTSYAIVNTDLSNLSAGEITAKQIITLYYDGSKWELKVSYPGISSYGSGGLLASGDIKLGGGSILGPDGSTALTPNATGGGFGTPGPVSIGPAGQFKVDTSGVATGPNMPGWVTPQMYNSGCGTGTTDCTAAINSALASGKNVFFPYSSTGYYYSNTLNLTTSGQIINFNGQHLVNSSSTPGSFQTLTNYNGGSPVHVDNVTIKNGIIIYQTQSTNPGPPNQAIDIEGGPNDCMIDNMTISHAPGYAVEMAGNTGTLAGTGDIIRNCHISYAGSEGILIIGLLSATVQNNFVDHSQYSGIDSNTAQATITGNTCNYNGQSAGALDKVSLCGIYQMIFPMNPSVWTATVVSGNTCMFNGSSGVPAGYGIMIGSPDDDPSYESYGYNSLDERITISNNVNIGNVLGGIYVAGQGCIGITGNIDSYNNTQGSGYGDIVVGAPIYTAASVSGINNGSISGNSIDHMTGNGIFINGNNWSATGNTIGGQNPNTGDSFYLQSGASQNIFSGNSILGTWGSFYVGAGSNGGNTFADNNAYAAFSSAWPYTTAGTGSYSYYQHGNRFSSSGYMEGTATLVAGTKAVSDPEAQVGDTIRVWLITPGGTPGVLYGSCATAGNITLSSTSGNDTSIVGLR